VIHAREESAKKDRIRVTDRTSENERVGQRIGPLARRRSFLVHGRASGFSYRYLSIVIKLPVTLYRIVQGAGREREKGSTDHSTKEENNWARGNDREKERLERNSCVPARASRLGTTASWSNLISRREKRNS